ncbi:very long-chain acyl- synthetase isoform 1 [Nannochloropsis gaditana]|uniref:Very long-chain acyl-synthetase isoform 1 n=1 Tax=Nannochloropsis gaditana TaxID=72520 RepID=W7TLW2_9STRA|nr:very long-chain acyl- synthetase isoform 1 [Nannochloropsis gaditana]
MTQSCSAESLGAGAWLVGEMQEIVHERRHKLVSDCRTGLAFLSVLLDMFVFNKPRTFARCFADAVRKWPDKVAVQFVDDGRELTFREIDLRANQVAHLLAQHGLGRGDVGAIMMTNKPEYIIVELAIAKLGAVSALLNFNLKGEPLRHSLQVAGAKLLVFDDELAQVVLPVVQAFSLAKPGEENGGPVKGKPGRGKGAPAAAGGTIPALFVGPGDAAIRKWAVSLDKGVAMQHETVPDPSILSNQSQNEPMSLVYTSGTTGLPKAAVVKHKRVFLMSMSFARQFAVRHSDKIYCTLPLYHSAGGNIGLGIMVNKGCTLALRSKFSASKFFKDVHDTGATVTQYIGELCRYLLATPPSPYDRKHKLRLAFGNGLRPDVWPRFVSRFNIPEIGEFYGATEGNVVFFNYWGRGEPSGAIGKGGFFNRIILGWTIVKFDPIKEEPIRDSMGRCVPCADGEAGELLARISGTSEFSGYYKNKEATEKKVLREAFGRKGSHWFRSGDLIMVDEQSYIHFVDRIGDTFRWKGENVSTTEVALALGRVDCLEEVNVVGVEVPGKDGRACLAAITLRDGKELDLDMTLEEARAHLPAYAVPLFLRVLKKGTQETTGTFKHMKAKYRTEGIDAGAIADDMYWLDPSEGVYKPYGKAEYQKIVSGKAKL